MGTGRSGDGERVERFQSIWTAYFAKVSGYTLRRVDSTDDAADCVAETFSIAWRKLERVPPDDEALYWLYAVAWRVIANHHRRNRRHAELTERLARELDRSLPSVHSPPDARALVAAGALAELSREDREVLRLASWEGLDSEGMARVLGCSPGTARVRLHRARGRLLARIEDTETDAATPPGHRTFVCIERVDPIAGMEAP